jgi:hypothetical protein
VRRIAILGLLLAAGCSSAADRDWADAERLPRAADLGNTRWSGTWHSDASGHEGTLRCIITPRADSGYDAHYYATFGWFIFGFSFEYILPMTIEKDDGGWRFRGSAVLDYWIQGGPYEYEGRADEEHFAASYNAGFDRGIFRMKRVK